MLGNGILTNPWGDDSAQGQAVRFAPVVRGGPIADVPARARMGGDGRKVLPTAHVCSGYQGLDEPARPTCMVGRFDVAGSGGGVMSSARRPPVAVFRWVTMLDERYRAALKQSRLAILPDETLEAVVAGAVFLDVPAGGTFFAARRPVFACVVIDGLVRTFLVSADGRQLTVRYTRPGDVNGATALYSRPLVNISQQAITDSRVLILRTESVVARAKSDVALANVLLVELAERSASYIHALASTTLSPLRENVVRHLLDLAAVEQPGRRLVARLSQQQLADHVGTVREVVGRILRDLKDQGLVLTGRDEIVLLDAERLHDLTWPRMY